MVKAVLVVLQTLLFLLLFAIGSFLPALPAYQAMSHPLHFGSDRSFELDGVLLALAAYLLILGVEVARKRLRGPGGLTTLALVLAFALGFAMKLGFKTI